MTAPNFLAFDQPSKAVACPVCKARIGVPCKRPSGHKAMTLHKDRHVEADRLWLIYDLPAITRRRDGSYVYDGPETRPSVTSPQEREQAMAKIGPKEQRARELREQRAGKTPKAPAPPAAQPEEKTMPKPKKAPKKTAKKAKAKKTKTVKARLRKPRPADQEAGGDALAPPRNVRADGLRNGSKQAIMLDMALAPGGATEAAICKVLDWKKCRVTLKRVCEKVGATLTQSKNAGGETVWSATIPAAQAAA